MGVSVTCCVCGKRFDERTLKGAWLDRRCPLCNGRLSEETYDEAARALIAPSAASDDHSPGRAQRTRRQSKRQDAQLDDLAQARYYTSEWFRLARASRGSEAGDKGLFGLQVSYDRADGAFRLTPADDDRSPDGGWGMSAEYRVFDALRAEIARKSSPLAGARLAPSLVFPWLPGQKPQQWGAKSRAEVDCVVLTQQCAVVVEVKRRTHQVRASADFAHISEQALSSRSRRSSDVRDQVINGAEAFAERQRLYPPERILKLVVFVEPVTFSCKTTTFRGGWLVSHLDADGTAPFVQALCQHVRHLQPVAKAKEVRALSDALLRDFGNTAEAREGRIVRGHAPDGGAKQRLTDALLADLERTCSAKRSPLHGARLLHHTRCEVQMGARRKSNEAAQKKRVKEVPVSGLLLTRSHAFLVDARVWPVHVNTHSPFATVYTGDPAKGARPVDDEIRHDWDLAPIHYENRSGSLTLLNYLSKCVADLDCYHERNRVYTLNVFVNPASFHTDREEFKQRTFIGYWRKRENNIVAALEALERDATPIMTQDELDAFADQLAAIGQ